MTKLSVAMIVRNEEAILEKALENIRIFADELIIVDTGSVDNTYQIAKKYADAVYSFEWIDDFAAANNAAQAHCSHPYFFRYDADFWISKKDAEALRTVKERDFDEANLISLTWVTEYGHQNEPQTTIRRAFIAKKDQFESRYPIHSTLAPIPGITVHLKAYPDILIHHNKNKQQKSHRYSQTLRLVEKTLEQSPNDIRLLMAYAQALSFDGQTSKVIEACLLLFSLLSPYAKEVVIVLELAIAAYCTQNQIEEAHAILQKYQQFHHKDPRFILLAADITSCFDTKAAVQLYELFLSRNFKAADTTFDYDYERFVTHPNIMLTELYYELRNFEKARIHCERVKQSALSLQAKIDVRILEKKLL